MQPQATVSWRPFEKEMGLQRGGDARRRAQRSFETAVTGELTKASEQGPPLDLHGAMRDPFGAHREYFRGNDYY
ncbi:MAG: hypothetical protein A3F84_05485 [Candidatus Handelsmanbacteria bacterium RIFCSPLOWO2_12_FULL_64_10]|uniref:Uncharacterized protein n=1 Tax=Handelsmanbacteria sp. (strain RIFCSPLOWO2_12_FULL_64_10) TaxID=1817868 RepID=A0A1F6C657_HANXR|nr:MAG: hypothetical protein A3F84_05485 [Candidatus Handelsmanbacteria bacterium RIFCSPLOWO2_12_FULL_64_10]